MKNVYLYDGSFDGFLTIVFNLFKKKEIPKDIKSDSDFRSNLFDNTIYIDTDITKSNRVINGIKKISDYSLHNIYHAFMSKEENKEMIIFDYIINLFKYKSRVNYMRNINSVLKLEQLAKNVRREAHKFKGFTRFVKLKKDIYYATIEPDNNVLEIVSNHFKERLKNEVWIIHDLKRNIASFYNKHNYAILDTKEMNFDNILKYDDELEYEKLWRSFYKSVNIKERKNLRCQMNFMPKKYWKHLTEISGE